MAQLRANLRHRGTRLPELTGPHAELGAFRGLQAVEDELRFDHPRRELALLAVFSWSVGVFLYAAAGIFVAARLLVYELRPADLTPPYWVSMGATAITVVAGARIVQMADAPMVAATRGLIAGASVMFWAFGTWLIAGARSRRGVAARGTSGSAALRGHPVEHRVPTRHVRRRRPLPRDSRPPAHRESHRRERELGRPSRVDADVPGHARPPHPEPATTLRGFSAGFGSAAEVGHLCAWPSAARPPAPPASTRWS